MRRVCFGLRQQNKLLTVNPNDIQGLQNNLRRYGYQIALSGVLDAATRAVLRAFQMHFRPADFSGEPDTETVALLEALLEKYRG